MSTTLQQPAAETIEAALRLAQRAPSIHNSQPWQWRFEDGELRLFADLSRHLTATDPDRRALELSCGAALHHARLALFARGWATEVRYLPDPDRPDWLATMRLAPRTPAAADISLSEAIPRRRSDRRRFDNGDVPRKHLRVAADYACRFGAQIHVVPEAGKARLGTLMRIAGSRHARDLPYQIELAQWSGRRGGVDGVPARNAAPVRPEDRMPSRKFADPELPDPLVTDDAEWLLICTAEDDRVARIRAGETLSALLLASTTLGLATCIQTEPLGIADLREEIRFSLCEGAFPQAMVRVGATTSATTPPPTPRRDLDEVFAGAGS
ncbi:Acg family FMN-binding oxidoreductase [Nocardia blacklockiae]|uniref:Acg family FMN-binding oxidoreductase n=1 Tax=Nocardia blacklockiae TaxID=480036 RepID=UPI001894D7EE|nr:nitroreductase family protein [Nocardia blacklockiae]MBF6175148.1 hypothetical protein [Nocardia blacklockiae]